MISVLHHNEVPCRAQAATLKRTRQERSIAVVLSGMGTNWTAGAQAIKAAGRLCLAQAPETAESQGCQREMVVFAPHDVLRDPPFSRVDPCTCRNLLIYLEADVQERVLKLMHFALKDGAHLFLGSAETLGSGRELFEMISQKYRIYRRIGTVSHRYAKLPSFIARVGGETNRAELAAAPQLTRSAALFALQQALFESFGPPTVIVDRDDRIVYFHGNTTAFFQQPLGEPLLVEDEQATEQAEQHSLKAAGAHVRTTASAATAREAFALRRPDVIVCDIGLPGEDGYVLMQAIRSLERDAQAEPILAVAVTAFVRSEDRQRALAAGFNEHLPKPVDPAKLIELLGRWRRQVRSSP
jgi:CheY-like chemotaxis protein